MSNNFTNTAHIKKQTAKNVKFIFLAYDSMIHRKAKGTMKHIILYSLLIGMAFLSGAQTPEGWTLERCIEQALAENIQLKIQENIGKKASYDRSQSQWNLAPSLNGWGNSSFDFRRSTNQNNEISSGPTYTMGYGISSSLNLFAGFTSINAIAANRFNELACREGFRLASNQLITEVIRLYANVVYQQSMIEIARQQLETSLLESERIAATIEVGQMEPVAQNEVNALVSGHKLDLTRAENDFRLLKLKLAQLIELPENTLFSLSPDAIENQKPRALQLETDSVYQAACLHYPSILEKEFEREYFRKILDISKGRLAPNITLSGGYSSGFYSTDTLANGKQTPVGTQFSDYLNPSVGLSLNIPILNGRYRDFQVKKSRIDLENALYELENQKKMIRREIEDALMQLDALYNESEHALANALFAEKSFETYREKYRLGLINTTGFMEAQNQLSRAKTEVLRTKYSWFVVYQTLKLYQGIL